MDLIKFFTSFDKLMKEKLVKAFYWLALVVIILAFAEHMLDAIGLKPLGAIPEFIGFFASFLLAIVGLRLAAEMAIALFRINDNLSPDGGKSETAYIDPLEEARRAAEEAAKRAREATSNVVSRTKAAAETTGESLSDTVEDVSDAVSDAAESVKETAKKTATKAKSTAKKTTSSTKLKKDGTPRKKPGPKPKS